MYDFEGYYKHTRSHTASVILSTQLSVVLYNQSRVNVDRASFYLLNAVKITAGSKYVSS